MRKTMVKKLGIWFLVISLFVAHLFLKSTVHADSPSVILPWQQVLSHKGECCIDFPSLPQRVQQSLKVSQSGETLNYDIYLAPFEDHGVFLLLIATYPRPVTKGYEMAGLEGLLKGIIQHQPNNELIFAKRIDLAGYEALDFLVQNHSSYFRGQALMVGNKLFLIAMEGRAGTRDEEVFSYFIRSFQLRGS